MKATDVTEHSEKLVAEVKRRVLLFCVDNPKFSGHMDVIEAAMLIGASITLEQNTNELFKPLPGMFKPTGKFLSLSQKNRKHQHRPR